MMDDGHDTCRSEVEEHKETILHLQAEISRLDTQVAALREALRWIADEGERIGSGGGHDAKYLGRMAARALTTTKEEHHG